MGLIRASLDRCLEDFHDIEVAARDERRDGGEADVRVVGVGAYFRHGLVVVCRHPGFIVIVIFVAVDDVVGHA